MDVAQLNKTKKSRTPIRSCLTRTITEAENLLKEEVPVIHSVYFYREKLDEIFGNLSTKDELILVGMLDTDCTDEEYETECITIERYRDNYRRLTLMIDGFCQERTIQTRSQVSDSANEDPYNSQSSTKKRTFKLPKIELRTYNGAPLEWLSWWNQFSKIHEDEELHVTDKFEYLVQSLDKGSRALELVESYPRTNLNYPKAIAALKNRCGKDDMLVEVYVRELQKLVISNVNSRETMKLSSMFDKLESHLRALESLNVTSANYAAMLYPMVESSIPEDVLRAWKRSSLAIVNVNQTEQTEDQSKKSKLDLLMDFLRSEVEAEESIALARDGFNTSTVKGKKKDKTTKQEDEDFSTAAGLFSSNNLNSKCVFCDGNHSSTDCWKAPSMSLDIKKEKLKSKRCCFICLIPNNNRHSCKARVQCQLCKRRHPIIMCSELPHHKIESSEKPKTACTAKVQIGDVPLQTLLVKYRHNGQTRNIRIILDCGNQRSYIRKASIKALNLKSNGQEFLKKGLFGGTVTNMEEHKKFEIKLEDMSSKLWKTFDVLEIKEICGQIESTQPGEWLKKLKEKGIMINDLNTEMSTIDILIGNDYYGQLLTGKVEHLQNGLTAIETIFGWTLSGRINKSESSAMLVTSLLCEEFSLSDLWNLETIGIRDPVETLTRREKEDATRKYFSKTVQRERDGRYCVSLPWIEGMKRIPDNKPIAERRLITTTVKLQSLGKYQSYEDIFTAWLNEGIIEEVPPYEYDVESYYLPHHAVFKPQSLTTPIRPVFDASCKTNRTPSLNECLEKGPNLLDSIPSILLRFRIGKIGIISDIRKAFLMINLREEDRNFVRFLWWSNPTTRLQKIYRHRRVVFGINSSPFLLGAVIEHHLNQVEEADQPVARKLLKSLYVDNSLTSVDTKEEAEFFRQTATRIMANAKMDLRQWEFSFGYGMEQSNGNEQHLTSVLGYLWDKKADALSLEVGTGKFPEKITKRSVLSCLQKIYDPLGFYCPVLMTPKLLIQKSFVDKVKWDTELNDENKLKFSKWYNELSSLKSIWIARDITGENNKRENWQLHLFCDASKLGYAAVTFLRTDNNGHISVSLIQAKSRVAPLKKISIPRLELISCSIGARLITSIEDAFEFKVPIYCWTDSTTVIAWINRNDEWGTFVGNRVKEIYTLTNVQNWRHIPGKFNPADLPSRGCSASELLALRWWEGPDWLRKPESDWPVSNEKADEELVQQEKKKGTVKCMLSTELGEPWYCQQSSYLKNVRVIAFMLRFIENARSKKSNATHLKSLSVVELRRAEERIWKMVQLETLPDGKVIEGLQVIKCENGFVRVKTKLIYRSDSEGFKLPILLPEVHPVVDQLIRDTHRLYCHAGIQFLMSKLREHVWIIRSRKSIRRVISECKNCLRFTSKRIEVVSAPLPHDRINDTYAFQVTGVDLAGPLYLKDQSKTWIVLFTCAVYRCVHLELVSSLGTDTFLFALERFIKRRVRPYTVYSDNGTNFTGTVNAFQLIDWTKVENEAATKRIIWKFNPPSAPWWGGWWERLVRIMKDLLKRTLGRSKLNYEELYTILVDIESIINGRPLTYVSEDPEDLIPLTPSMFLQENTNKEFPETELNLGRKLRIRLKYQKQLKEELRARFRKEYLALLVQRGNEPKTTPVRVGDIVLIGDDNKKRLNWPMGKIIEIYPSKDGNSRVVKLKTSKGMLTRDLRRLYPLEISATEEIPEVNKFVSMNKNSLKATSRVVHISQEDIVVNEKVEKTTRSGRKINVPERFGSSV